MANPAPGALAVALARRALEDELQTSDGRPRGGAPPSETLPAALRERRGVFVTLRAHPSGDLRGCIGFPLPVLPLYEAVAEAAVSAAVEDPRFPRVRLAELGTITVEVSILTTPERLHPERPEDLPGLVEVGRDGLIVESGGVSGLLLPQVAVEQGWSAAEFLEEACLKAGLSPGAWRLPSTRVSTFSADVWGESTPGGEPVRSPGSVSVASARSSPRR